MKEKPKRLQPTPETQRELYLKSGNLCAFPGCPKLLMTMDGVWTGQICHIEAAETGGPRFNENMTNEQRRHVSNLMLMCYDHHKITDDVEKYKVSTLQKMKDDHEQRFYNGSLDAMQFAVKDWTQEVSPILPSNLKRLFRILNWPCLPEDADFYFAELNNYVEEFRKVPIQLRLFFGAALERLYLMKRTRLTEKNKIKISDLAYALRIDGADAESMAIYLDDYGIAGLDRIDHFDRHNHIVHPALRIYTTTEGWDLWGYLAWFCECVSEPLSTFYADLNFSSLADAT